MAKGVARLAKGVARLKPVGGVCCVVGVVCCVFALAVDEFVELVLLEAVEGLADVNSSSEVGLALAHFFAEILEFSSVEV